jgi:adenine-specific DNA methylase
MWAWGGDTPPAIADPTAGGGSIPFCAARFGLPTYANDLNGVAAAILEAAVAIPNRHGDQLLPPLIKYGNIWKERVRERLDPLFHYEPRENYITYIWANAVRCPRTGGLVPLITDLWLNREKGRLTAVRFVGRDPGGQILDPPHFEIVQGDDIDFDPSRGFMSGGSGISPYDDLVIDGNYIKDQAKAGNFENVLYAVYFRRTDGKKGYRAPTDRDLDDIAAARVVLAERRAEWESTGCIPAAEITAVSNYDRGHRMYGVNTWAQMFTERQLVVHAVIAEEFQCLSDEVRARLGRELGDAVMGVLGMVQGKALNYNAKSISWDISRQKIRSVFEKHNFTFRWTFAEFQGSRELPEFALSQIVAAYEQLAVLLNRSNGGALIEHGLRAEVKVAQGNAADLRQVPTGSITNVCMDPPYYDNVMYAELSDFFYVWEKGVLGRIFPSYYAQPEADKDDEAIANLARFARMGRRRKELADLDYEAKMTGVFAECHRLLRDDGVLSVMFTHKRADAWDALGQAIITAGFTIETSWPVNTEPEASSHQSGKNAANSTIILVCRKRRDGSSASKVFFDDIEGEVRLAARDALIRFRADGIDGVDLLLSTYGPVLSVISQQWPVYSTAAGDDGKARLLRPEEALDVARAEVVRLQTRRLVGRELNIDEFTDFALIAWETFKAREFPFDEARRLALAVGGLDVDDLSRARILEKKSGMVRLLSPRERLRRDGSGEITGVRLDATAFDYTIDAVHTVLYVAAIDGMGAAKAFMERLDLINDQRFIATAQGLVNAIPRAKVKGEWVVPEAGLLDTLAVAYLPEVVTPPDEPSALDVEEPTLFDT